MKRIVAISMLALTITGLLAVPVAAQDVRGPRCADIVDGSGVYDGSTVNFRITTEAASCRAVTYTLYVLDEEGGALLASQSKRGTGNNQVFFNVSVSDPDETVCVYATTSVGRHVFDRAPDSGCVDLTVGAGPPARFFR